MNSNIINKSKVVKSNSLAEKIIIDFIINKYLHVLLKYLLKDITWINLQLTITKEVTLNTDKYEKREKIFENGVWLNTKPIFINDYKKSLILR